MINKYLFLLIPLLLFSACLDPYHASISKYENLLVVDAQLTNEYKCYKVKLTRTTSSITEEADKVTGAHVTIEDDKNRIFTFSERGEGIYLSDSTEFQGAVGSTYTLKITTTDGEKYQSAPCSILPTSQIDNLFFELDKGWSTDGTQEFTGISIYLNGNGLTNNYLRYTYEEDWKFRVNYASNIIITPENKVISGSHGNVVCWKQNRKHDISILTFNEQVEKKINKKQIAFVPTVETDKTSIRYRILVKQHSISREEYDYWNKLKKSTEDIGDVIGKQPFSITGNIVNINNKSEPVLGFFQVSNVTNKHLYINASEIRDKEIPNFRNKPCELDSLFLEYSPYNTIYDAYYDQVLNGNRYLFSIIETQGGFPVPIGITLVDPICADCSLTGSIVKPSFWQD